MITIRKKKGFTLIELLVVVLIIGILAAIALPQYQKAVMKAKIIKYASILPALKIAYKEFTLVKGRDMANTDLDEFYESWLDDGRVLGLECKKEYGSRMCYFQNGDRLQMNHWLYPGSMQTFYWYFPNILGQYGGATGIYINFKYSMNGLPPDSVWLTVQESGLDGAAAFRARLCAAGESVGLFREVCGKRI